MFTVNFSKKKIVRKTVADINKYPCIGKNFGSNLVVGFFKSDVGIVIVQDDFHPLYEVRNDWLMDRFEYLNAGTTASINITNE